MTLNRMLLGFTYHNSLLTRDGNFALPRLTRLSPLRLVRVFPAPQRWWSGNKAIF